MTDATEPQVDTPGDSPEETAERLRSIEARIEQLERENDELRAQLRRERHIRQQLISTPRDDPTDAGFREVFLAGKPVGTILRAVEEQTDRIESEVDTLGDKLDDETHNRGVQDAKLRRRIEAVADKAGVDLTESDLLGDDKIVRVLKHGAEDVVDRAFPVHFRAQAILRNLGEWGRLASDSNGRRHLLATSEAKQRLKDKRDESLNSKEVHRAFRKIVEWGEDSPRTVTTTKRHGERYLIVQLEGGQ